jgi:poly(A) polymerase
VAASQRAVIVDAQAMRAAIYWNGIETAVDRVLLSGQAAIAPLLGVAQHWAAPRLPVSGKHLIAAGLPPGPAVSAALIWFEIQWVAADFDTSGQAIESLIKAAVSRSRLNP